MLQLIYRLRENHMYPFFIWGCLYTGSKFVVVTMYSIFFFAPFGWLMNDLLYCLEYVTTHHLVYSGMVTGYNKQNYRMAPCVFFSHFWLRRRLSFEGRDFFITSNHLIVLGCVCCCKMSQPSKRWRFLQSSKIAELFLDSDSGDATVSSDTSSVEGGPESVPGMSHTHPYRQTASNPRVLKFLFLLGSPAVQFRPVPLT